MRKTQIKSKKINENNCSDCIKAKYYSQTHQTFQARRRSLIHYLSTPVYQVYLLICAKNHQVRAGDSSILISSRKARTLS